MPESRAQVCISADRWRQSEAGGAITMACAARALRDRKEAVIVGNGHCNYSRRWKTFSRSPARSRLDQRCCAPAGRLEAGPIALYLRQTQGPSRGDSMGAQHSAERGKDRKG
jgi:hypothetical protein